MHYTLSGVCCETEKCTRLLWLLRKDWATPRGLSFDFESLESAALPGGTIPHTYLEKAIDITTDPLLTICLLLSIYTKVNAQF
jgi:hypothetical protein